MFSYSIGKKNLHLLKFEELLKNTVQKIKYLCDFLNVEFHESMLLIPKIGSSIVNEKKGLEKGLGIDQDRTGHFLKKLTSTEINLCQKITAQYTKQFGYDDVQVRLNFFSLIVSYISFPVKLFFALLLNLKRSKNLFNSIKRRF